MIIDDFALNRECLADRLAEHYSHVRCAWSLPTLFRETEREMPSVVLLNFATDNSANLLQLSHDLESAPRVIVYGLSEERDVVLCAEAGAAALHLRSESFDHLLDIIRAVSNGHNHCSPEASSMLLGHVYSKVGRCWFADPTNGTLTARELEILALLEEGLTNQQIASRLSLTVHTVKNHVHSLLAKLGVGSRVEASRVARAMKYVGNGNGRPDSRMVSR
jgi:DNA-binding NarL/FixJ family response regulator